MTKLGAVNYLIHKPERQAFHIDAGGVAGKLVSPELAQTRVALTDLRGASVDFTRDCVGFAHYPSKLGSFDEADWQRVYDAELTAFLTREIGAKDVIVFDHTLREDDPNSDRRPARNVHGDYSRQGAENRLVDLLGVEKAAEWAEGRYGFINIWRPVGNPINSAPLGFVRPSSTAPEDWILIDLIYPDRRGSIMGLAANPDHDWIYWSRMTPDEIAFFNIYDNRGLPPIAHSAVDLTEDPTVNTIRKSIESRTLVRY